MKVQYVNINKRVGEAEIWDNDCKKEYVKDCDNCKYVEEFTTCDRCVSCIRLPRTDN